MLSTAQNTKLLLLMYQMPHTQVCNSQKLLDSFIEANKLLESVQKGLADYLETKRLAFARFFFLSNDELLQILSQTKNPLAVQVRVCFVRMCVRTFAVGSACGSLQLTSCSTAAPPRPPAAPSAQVL